MNRGAALAALCGWTAEHAGEVGECLRVSRP
jgi:hypothetical protein